MKSNYLETIQAIERLHRQFLEVIKAELDRQGIEDVNNVQSLILSQIGEDELTVGELTYRGYYQGSNVSYNVKKLVENDYLLQERSAHDRRNIKVRVSSKGKAICDLVEGLYDRHAAALPNTGIPEDGLSDVNATLKRLERFWAHELAYGPAQGIPAA